ncbi:transaldolase [Thermomonospora catenispora]|uniref:transaldolase n=1 Tax=Thermomonospora catenispora TaxID=2493090 RepID=UPI00112166F0|nr:transaldolase [Thermomonospora catenispora]TNY37366.1 transaldolase [Thermomonospora catenispora]
MSETLHKLSSEGVAIWLDDISRDRLRTGNLEDLIRDRQVVGVTSNPTIFAKALSKGRAYDEQLRDLAVRGVDVEEAVRMITTYDIRWSCDVLRPVYERSDHVDGRVSIEVDPRLARDAERTVAEARALWWLVDRPNLFIKIPATREGLPAITQAISEGISVNVTLIFSLERYGQVIDAYFEGLEKARAAGRDISQIASVASFFVSRVDTEIDKRLDKIGSAEAKSLKGKAGVANARLAYALYEEKIASDRWKALKDAGARPQRPLWASTGVKDPSLPDTLYVEELVAPGTVNTMPEATLEAVADHGRIRGDSVRGAYDEARAHMAALQEAGVDYDDVVRVLEEEGVDKFEASWQELLGTVERELADKGGAR